MSVSVCVRAGGCASTPTRSSIADIEVREGGSGRLPSSAWAPGELAEPELAVRRVLGATQSCVCVCA